LLNQSMPVMLTTGHICFVLISPPGELTSIVCFMVAIGRLCFTTKLDDMNEMLRNQIK
jgi:hypothetical protein